MYLATNILFDYQDNYMNLMGEYKWPPLLLPSFFYSLMIPLLQLISFTGGNKDHFLISYMILEDVQRLKKIDIEHQD